MALYSTESEYKALSQISIEIARLNHFLWKFGVVCVGNAIVWCGNPGACSLANSWQCEKTNGCKIVKSTIHSYRLSDSGCFQSLSIAWFSLLRSKLIMTEKLRHEDFANWH